MLTERAHHANAVWAALRRRIWWTAEELTHVANSSLRPSVERMTTASATARIRDFRKPEYGGHTILCEHRPGKKAPAYMLVR